MLLAAQEDFAQDVRNLQFTGLILAIVASAAFIPVVWIFGGGMSRSLRDITAQAVKLQTLAAPGPSSVTSRIKEVHELGSAMELAQRAIWSLAHFVPKEIVQRIVDNSISTELGGVREEITVAFRRPDFTTIAESDDPDSHAPNVAIFFRAYGGLPRRRRNGLISSLATQRWCSGTHPPQPDHVERACRAALAGRRR
jgi:adenylate cyclase